LMVAAAILATLALRRGLATGGRSSEGAGPEGTVL
jgi:hypothetical protein